MVDKALFIGTSGANNSMHELQIITNNLANVNTTGFRGDFESMKQYQMDDKGQQSRTYSTVDKSYSDFKPGPIIHTERDLDVAISGEGFIAVQTKAGKEAYTRAGDLQITNDGMLVTKGGELVLGTSGLINTGQAQQISIGADGTISARLAGEPNLIAINRIKLANPATSDLHKGADGLFYLAGDAAVAKQDDTVRVIPGAIEGSNVNPVKTLVDLIELSRQFELHTNLMKTMQDESTTANKLLEMPH